MPLVCRALGKRALPCLVLPLVTGMSLSQEEQRKQLTTALPLPRQSLKTIGNFSAAFHRKRLVTSSESKNHSHFSFVLCSQSPHPRPHHQGVFLLQPQPPTKGSTSWFFLSEAEILRWDCDGLGNPDAGNRNEGRSR